jgi:hypothetical protein
MSKFTAEVGQDAAHLATSRPIDSQCAGGLRTIGVIHGFFVVKADVLKGEDRGLSKMRTKADKGREGEKVGDFMRTSFVHHPL